MALFPIFAELSGQPCLVVGGGEIAWRKASHLLEAGAALTINAPVIEPRLQEMVDDNRIRWVEGLFDPQLIAETTLVIAATSDESVNVAVAAEAARHHVLCNVVDELEQCSFIMPATIQRGPVSIAISTAGYAPVLARWIKAFIESWLPARIDVLAKFAYGWRSQVKKSLSTMRARRRLWEEVFDGPIAEHVLAGRDAAANRLMTEKLATTERVNANQHGEAWLVGAGPGEADLITVRGKQLLAKADVVLYDRLVAPELLRFARREADLIFVGKRPGQSTVQQEINRLLVEKVSAGHRVCRLKGGDAFVFGRGGEEIEALEAAGLDYQIVPGITAALACAAFAGIPLTHRAQSHAVWLGTGHAADDDAQADWQAMAASTQTLALYMSVGKLDAIVTRLQTYGRDPQTPVAIVENGARPQQRVLRSTLAGVAAAATRHGIAAPAIVFIGEAAAEAGRHPWFAPEGFIDDLADWPQRAAASA